MSKEQTPTSTQQQELGDTAVTALPEGDNTNHPSELHTAPDPQATDLTGHVPFPTEDPPVGIDTVRKRQTVEWGSTEDPVERAVDICGDFTNFTNFTQVVVAEPAADRRGMFKQHLTNITKTAQYPKSEPLAIPKDSTIDAYYEDGHLLAYIAHAIDNETSSGPMLSRKHLGINPSIAKARVAALFLNKYLEESGDNVELTIEDGKVVIEEISVTRTKRRL